MFKNKAKELFEKWYEKSGIPQSSEIEFYAGDSSGYMGIWLDNFYKLPFSMQQGVYLQFLREQGVDVDVFGTINNDLLSVFPFSEQGEGHSDVPVRWRITSITNIQEYNKIYDTVFRQAITKAGELLNERSGK